jgi:threonine dehydrogenase-like Zn-dependent dehydrogenase
LLSRLLFRSSTHSHSLREPYGRHNDSNAYGGFLDKILMGSAIDRGLTFRVTQTPVQHYLPKLLDRVEKGEIDPSFVIAHRAPLEQGSEL